MEVTLTTFDLFLMVLGVITLSLIFGYLLLRLCCWIDGRKW